MQSSGPQVIKTDLSGKCYRATGDGGAWLIAICKFPKVVGPNIGVLLVRFVAIVCQGLFVLGPPIDGNPHFWKVAM